MDVVNNKLESDLQTKKLKKSAKIALSGVICALSAALMFMTGVFPMASLALPCLAGMLLVVIVVEMGRKTAAIAYIATSITILLVTPDIESALLYIFFFGHYGILKSKIESISNVFVEFLLKFLSFNICVVTAYCLIGFLFGFAQIIEQFGSFGKYSILIFLALGNVVFLIYDFAISNMVMAYQKVFKPKFLGRYT